MKRTKYDKTFYVKCDGVTKHTCKTKKTAVKYATQFLDSMLYEDVTIDCLTIRG